MAKLYVSEYSDAPAAGYTALGLQIVKDPALVEQTPVAIGASAAPSAAFSARTRIVRLHADAICSIVVGPVGVVATANSQRMAANQTEYKMVDPGNIVSVITNT